MIQEEREPGVSLETVVSNFIKELRQQTRGQLTDKQFNKVIKDGFA